jgi:hypothetical protein
MLRTLKSIKVVAPRLCHRMGYNKSTAVVPKVSVYQIYRVGEVDDCYQVEACWCGQPPATILIQKIDRKAIGFILEEVF